MIRLLTVEVASWGAWVWWGLAGMVCAALGGWCGFSAWWRRRAETALGERVSVELVPSADFDTSEEEVGRFASQLGRVTAAAGGLPARASAVRLQMSCEDRTFTYRLEGPARAAGILRLAGYPGVEIREPGGEQQPPRIRFDGAPPLPRRAGGRVRLSKAAPRREEEQPPAPVAPMYQARAELMLARPDHRPLASLALRPDPLQLLASAFTHVRSEAGEEAGVVVDLLPVAREKVARRRRRLIVQARRRGPTAFGESLGGGGRWGRWCAEVLEGMNGGKPVARVKASSSGTGGGVPRQSDVNDGVGKFRPGAEVFAVQVLVHTAASHPERARARLHQVLAALDAGKGENWWRPVGPRRGGWRPYSNVAWRRVRFDRRLVSGEFAPARRRQWVTTQEIAAWLKPPTVHCQAPNVRRCAGVVAPAPVALPTWTGQKGVVPHGLVTGADGRLRLAASPAQDVLFGSSLGRSGYGKTEAALLQAISLAYGGFGAWFLDPHGEAVQRALPYLAHPAIQKRLWVIDLKTPRMGDRRPSWNPLSMEGRRVEEVQDVIGSVVGAIASAQGWGDGAPRARTILSHAVRALAQLSFRLCQEGRMDLQPTIFQIRSLLIDDEWRQEVLSLLPRKEGTFWRTTFPKYAGEAVPVVTNALERLENSLSLRAFLGSPRSSYDVRRAMDERRVVFLCPSGTGESDQLITSLLLFDLFRAGLSRGDAPSEERPTFWAFVDELTAVDGASHGYVAKILEQLRKYEVRFMGMTQMAMRLSAETRLALMQNQSVLSATAADTDEASFVAKRMPGIKPETILSLDKYSYLVTTTLRGKRTAPFRVRGVPIDEVLADYHRPEGLPALEQAIDANLRRRTVADITDALDALDEAILEQLAGTAGRPGPEPGDGAGDVVHRIDDEGEAA